MVKQISTWVARDGSTHPTKEAALRRELFLLVKPIVESEAIAMKFVAGINRAGARELADTISELGGQIKTPRSARS